jgi:hypothetical protein
MEEAEGVIRTKVCTLRNCGDVIRSMRIHRNLYHVIQYIRGFQSVVHKLEEARNVYLRRCRL